MAETLNSTGETMDILKEALTKFHSENPSESDKLKGQILEWGSAIPSGAGTLGEVIVSQIENRVSMREPKGKTTVRQFIEELFSPNDKGELNADIVMGRLQIG